MDIDVMIGLISILIAALYPILITHERRLSKLEGKIDIILNYIDGNTKCGDKNER